MTRQEAYTLLEISESSSDTDIKKAYRRLAKKYHPDVSPNNEAKFIQVQKAYEFLKSGGNGGNGGTIRFTHTNIFDIKIER